MPFHCHTGESRYPYARKVPVALRDCGWQLSLGATSVFMGPGFRRGDSGKVADAERPGLILAPMTLTLSRSAGEGTPPARWLRPSPLYHEVGEG